MKKIKLLVFAGVLVLSVQLALAKNLPEICQDIVTYKDKIEQLMTSGNKPALENYYEEIVSSRQLEEDHILQNCTSNSNLDCSKGSANGKKLELLRRMQFSLNIVESILASVPAGKLPSKFREIKQGIKLNTKDICQ